MKSRVVVADQLPVEGAEFSVQLNSEELGTVLAERGPSGLRAAGGLDARVRLLPSGNDLFCLGRYRAKIAGLCSRCLEPASHVVEGEFHLTFVEELETSGGAEQELHREDLDLDVLHEGAVDLTEVVAEQFILGLPPHLLCAENCRGLCPSCGTNRNREPCDCAARAADPRFAVLASLKSRDAVDDSTS